MAEDDNGSWRRRLAEERLGDSLTPGFARVGHVNAPDPAGRPPSAPRLTEHVPSETYRAAPPVSPRIAATSAPARSALGGTIGWIVAALLAVLLAGVVGWFLRGGDRQIVYVPVAAPLTNRAVTPADGRSSVGDQGDASPPVEVPSTVLSPAVQATSETPPAGGHANVPAPAPKMMAPKTTTKHKTLPIPAKPIIRVVPAPLAIAHLPCVDGNGPASRTLCDDATLRRFDEQARLAEIRVIAHNDRPLTAEAARDRARFIRRREKCGDTNCLRSVYSDWIVALVKLLPAGDATPPICLPEQYTRTPIMNCWPSRLRPIRPPFYSK